MNKKALLSH